MAMTGLSLGPAITAISRASREEWLRAVESLAEAVLAVDTDGTILFLNPAAERLLVRGRDELLGAPLTEVIPERFRRRHRKAFSRYLATGSGRMIGRPVSVPMLRGDGTEVQVELLISGVQLGGVPLFLGLVRDVSKRIELEGTGSLADRLVSTLAEAETLDEAWVGVLRALVESLNWALAQLWLPDGTNGVLRRHTTWAAPGSRYATFVEASGGTFPPRVGLPGRVWASGAPAWVRDLAADDNFPRADAAARAGLCSGMAFPLLAGDQALGVIELFSTEARDPDAALSQRLHQLGRELGWFLDRRAREEERLALIDAERAARADAEAAQQRLQLALDDAASLAATLQQSLLPPHLPDMPGIEIAARYFPAGGGSEVGGDFYDVFRLTKDSWGVVIGDVCGKGAAAAAVTALARYTVRTAAMQVRSPAGALRILNDAMLRQAADGGPDLFVTVTFVRLRRRADRLEVTLARGGHPPALIKRADGTVEELGRLGTIMGAVEQVELHDVDAVLAPGDTLVLVTDGVLEARRNGDFFGDDRLHQLLRAGAGDPSPAGIASMIAEAAITHQCGQIADDIAIVALAPRTT